MLLVVDGWEELVKGTQETTAGNGAHMCIVQPRAPGSSPAALGLVLAIIHNAWEGHPRKNLIPANSMPPPKRGPGF